MVPAYAAMSGAPARRAAEGHAMSAADRQAHEERERTLHAREEAVSRREVALAEQRRVLTEQYRLLGATRQRHAPDTQAPASWPPVAPASQPAPTPFAPDGSGRRLWSRVRRVLGGAPTPALDERS
jgi:hypothetical protein